MDFVTVYSQQISYHRVGGETHCPSMMFMVVLVGEITNWVRKDKIIILMMDSNKDMNTVKL